MNQLTQPIENAPRDSGWDEIPDPNAEQVAAQKRKKLIEVLMQQAQPFNPMAQGGVQAPYSPMQGMAGIIKPFAEMYAKDPNVFSSMFSQKAPADSMQGFGGFSLPSTPPIGGS